MAAANASWPKIEFTDERLENGLRLIMSVDRLTPTVAVNLWYNVGSQNEAAGSTGLAHLFEHMMFEGSAHVAKGEHFKLINNAGGTLNATTWLHRTNYFEWAPSHNLELMLWLEADRLGGLLDALNQQTLDNQRDVVRNEKRYSYDNRPYGSFQERLQATLFPDNHPYHHTTIGSMEDLSAATLDDVKDFFRTYYAPNNATLSIVGDFEPTRAREWVKKYFGAIPARAGIPVPPPSDLPLTLGAESRQLIPDRVPLPRVYVGFRAPADLTAEHDALEMASAVLSMGRGSRLYRRLVREGGLARDTEFGVMSLPGVSAAIGSATARPGVAVEDLEPAFLGVIDGIATDEITDDEIARARAQVERLVIDHLMTVASRADWLSEHAVLFDDPGKVNERLPRLLSVTPEQIQKVAAEVLVPDNRAVFIYAPGEDSGEKKK